METGFEVRFEEAHPDQQDGKTRRELHAISSVLHEPSVPPQCGGFLRADHGPMTERLGHERKASLWAIDVGLEPISTGGRSAKVIE